MRIDLSDQQIKALAREIAARLHSESLLDAADVAAMLKCSARYVTERYAKLPGFPRPIRLQSRPGRVGKPRWKREAIVAWIDAHEPPIQRPPGRPRKQLD